MPVSSRASPSPAGPGRPALPISSLRAGPLTQAVSVNDADKPAGPMLVVLHAQEVPSDRSPNDCHRTAVASSDDGG